MQNYKHSPVLFIRGDGLPMEFYVRMCANERSEIKALIEHGGGVVRFTEGKNIIRLVPVGSKVLRFSKEGLTISVQFIYDCVALNRLLDTSGYVVRVISAKTSDISDEDDDFRETKRPSALPFTVREETTSLKSVVGNKSNEKVQRVKRPLCWTNGVREGASPLIHNLSGSSSSSGTDHRLDESISLLHKKSTLGFKVPDREDHQNGFKKSCSSSKCDQQLPAAAAMDFGERTSCQKTGLASDSETSSEAADESLDVFDVSMLGKSHNCVRTSIDVGQVKNPTVCANRSADCSFSSGYQKNPSLPSFGSHEFSQPSSSNETHISPTPPVDSHGTDVEVPLRREMDLDITEAAYVLKDIENLVLFCKLCEDSGDTVEKARQVNRLKRMIYKSFLASDVEAVLKKKKLSTLDRTVLFKYLLCEKNIPPKSAMTLLSKFLDDSQHNSRISKKKT